MRAFVNIVGVGQRKAGTGKTGNPYDFTPVAFTYPDRFIAGEKAATVNIGKDCLGEYEPHVGDTVEVVMHEDFKTGRVYVDAVLA